jgi:integrase/recombinase XerD
MFTAESFALQNIEMPEARKADRRGQARSLTEENLVSIFAVLPGPKWQAVFAIAYFTGSRISEVLSLDVADLATDDRISFKAQNTKTRKPRVAMVVEALRPFLAAYDAPAAGHLFPAHHNGQGGGLSRQAADTVLRNACDMIALDGVSTHSFRRSFATNLHKAGYSLAKIARLLGHSSASMTARYVD